MPATLKSRFPQIIVELGIRADTSMRAGAELVEQEAKVRAPDRPPIGEGLVDAIHTKRDRAGSYYVVGGDDDHWYGHLQEFGTAHHAPQPFLVPALESQRDNIVGLVAAALRDL